MANNLFNYTSQRLNAERLRQINSFNSYNFAGIIGPPNFNPFSDDPYVMSASPESPVFMMGGGLLLSFTENVEFDTNIPGEFLGYIKVTLDEETGTVITDEYSGIEVGNVALEDDDSFFDKYYTIFTVVDSFGAGDSPAVLNYYEYEDNMYIESSDEEVDITKTYYTKYESSTFSFRVRSEFGNSIYHYNGNTIWISDNVFIIPMIVRLKNDSGGWDIKHVVQIRDLRDLEGFLSLEAYSKLKAYCEGTFVWTVGGEEEVEAPDGTIHKKGDIGSLNVTDNRISNQDDGERVEISSLRLGDIQGSPDGKLYVNSTGDLLFNDDYRTPVERGGTYVSNADWNDDKARYFAKRNLGIFYGTADPSSTNPIPNPMEGDIYLQIIDS